MEIPTFRLSYAPNTSLCIQCPADVGQPLTLQLNIAGAASQIWTAIFRSNRAGDTGICFINPAMNVFIASVEPPNTRLIVRPFPSDASEDVWTILSLPVNTFRIAAPRNTSLRFTDYGGQVRPGDSVVLTDDASPISTWVMNP